MENLDLAYLLHLHRLCQRRRLAAALRSAYRRPIRGLGEGSAADGAAGGLLLSHGEQARHGIVRLDDADCTQAPMVS